MRWKQILLVTAATLAVTFGAGAQNVPQLQVSIGLGDEEAQPPERRNGTVHYLSASDHAIYLKAFDAADHKDWQGAQALAMQAQDSVARHIIEWRYLTDRNSGASFTEIDAFIRNHSDWPLQSDAGIARRTGAMADDMPASRSGRGVVCGPHAANGHRQDTARSCDARDGANGGGTRSRPLRLGELHAAGRSGRCDHARSFRCADAGVATPTPRCVDLARGYLRRETADGTRAGGCAARRRSAAYPAHQSARGPAHGAAVAAARRRRSRPVIRFGAYASHARRG